MRTAPLLIAISLCCMVNTSVLAHRDVVPDNYPSHKPSSDCTEPVGIAGLQQKLREYNISRIEVGNVLQAMADNYNLEDDVREGLLGFAEHFEQMGKDLPNPDPDSEEFRNFDFKIGLTLTAVMVYLNTRDNSLTEQFHTDQKDPYSILGRYLTELDLSRDAYLAKLEDMSNTEKTGTCS